MFNIQNIGISKSDCHYLNLNLSIVAFQKISPRNIKTNNHDPSKMKKRPQCLLELEHQSQILSYNYELQRTIEREQHDFQLNKNKTNETKQRRTYHSCIKNHKKLYIRI
ncbi:hypothetical protein ABPG72_020825 [Tetrahymena utriculariae]